MNTTKVCCNCKCELSAIAFHHNRSTPDGLHRECKECKAKSAIASRQRHKEEISAHNKIYRASRKEQIKVQRHQHYLDNKERITKRNTTYITQNRTKHNTWATNSRNKLKAEVFSHYCGGEPKCQCCGEPDLYLLTIDHINGGGNEHRAAIGVKTGYPFYQWLKKNGFPEGFQVLCWNCQFKKKNKECKPANPTHLQEVRAAYVQRIKAECLEHYGGACHCGESDQIVLTLDHVNDDGVKHREETGTRGFNFYMMLRKSGFPNDPPLQVLCQNCQYKKREKYYEQRKINESGDGNGSAVIV